MITDSRSRSRSRPPTHWAALFHAAWRGVVELLALWRVRRGRLSTTRR